MVHEGPAISPSSKSLVEQGMVFTVEPGVYIPGWGGVRIEDMVLVTGSGVTVLTTLPRELLWSEPTASA
jgi:Xaa-Pro aminopeptidase